MFKSQMWAPTPNTLVFKTAVHNILGCNRFTAKYLWKPQGFYCLYFSAYNWILPILIYPMEMKTNYTSISHGQNVVDVFVMSLCAHVHCRHTVQFCSTSTACLSSWFNTNPPDVSVDTTAYCYYLLVDVHCTYADWGLSEWTLLYASCWVKGMW